MVDTAGWYVGAGVGDRGRLCFSKCLMGSCVRSRGQDTSREMWPAKAVPRRGSVRQSRQTQRAQGFARQGESQSSDAPGRALPASACPTF